MYERSQAFTDRRSDLLAGQAKAVDFLSINFEDLVRSILTGIKIFEFAARDGRFLKFCKERGATVAGMTDGRYFEFMAQRLSDARGPLVYGLTSEIDASHIAQIRPFQPDLVVSVNLFDKKRPLHFEEPRVLQNLLSAWAACACDHTLFSIITTADSESSVHLEDFARFALRTKSNHNDGNFRVANLQLTGACPILARSTSDEERATCQAVYNFNLRKYRSDLECCIEFRDRNEIHGRRTTLGAVCQEKITMKA